jgi:hypothetical protein
MAQRIERVTEVTTPVAPQAVERQQVREVEGPAEPAENVAARVIWFIAGILLVLLGLRFVLALLGANPSNGFANFIYTTSHPFVSPFFGLFSYDLRYGVSRFETFTLVAMAVYALIAYGLSRLVTLRQPRA